MNIISNHFNPAVIGSALLRTLLLAMVLLQTPVAPADEKQFLTVDKLLANGYVKLSGNELFELMKNSVIRVVDIETSAVTISRHDADTVGLERKFSEAKQNKPLYFLDTRLLARAPPLDGNIRRKVDGDELVATDGIRTYRYSVYRKQGRLFAVRDIDHGNVFFEVMTQ